VTVRFSWLLPQRKLNSSGVLHKKKTRVEFLTGIHNLGYLPHELLSPECDDCCNCVVDGLSPSGFEGGGLMWRLPV